MVPWGGQEALNIAQRVTSGLSIFGSGTVCLLYLYLKWWNFSTHHVLLFWISISDIIFSLAVFTGPWFFEYPTLCTIQGWACHVFGLSTQIWCTIVGLNLWLQMHFYWKDNRCRTLMPNYHAFAWGIPLILGTIPAVQHFMMPFETLCYVKPSKKIWRMCTLGIPLWIIFFCNLCIILLNVRLVRRIIASLPENIKEGSKIKQHYRFVACQTLMFVFVGMFCWILSTSRFIYYLVQDQDVQYEWKFFGTLMLPGQGIFNLLIYVVPSKQCKCCGAEPEGCGDQDTLSEIGSNRKSEDEMEMGEIIEDKIYLEHVEIYGISNLSLSLSFKRSSTFKRFKTSNERMSFYDGLG